MPTMHEAVAAAAAAAVVALFATPGDPQVTREEDLPEVCPPAGLVNVRFEDPVEEERCLGAVTRYWSRVCGVEIVVQAAAQPTRIARHDLLVARLGALQGAAGVGAVIDFVDVGSPTAAEEIPIEGAATIKGSVVELTLYYRTGDNPMEDIG